SVDTAFGKLVVPIDRVRSFTPGLDSNTKLSERIETQIKNLASDDYQTREQAHKDLAAMGRNVQKELQRFVSDDNAEIKRQAGDKISLKAEGSIVMSPWGGNSASGPDGAANYGWYIPNQIPGGALVARIGEKGTIFKVGRQSNFVAKNSGVLQFAIAMQAEYASENYAFPGQYTVKLKVDPK